MAPKNLAGRRPQGQTFAPKKPLLPSDVTADGKPVDVFVPAGPAGPAGPGRVKNAKDLRQNYTDIAGSPDGVDPFPLTVPKCVECSHCGWPVFVRESKVATKKTYERAGIHRGPKEKDPNAPAKEKKEGEEEEEEDDGDSRDTIEKLEDEVEELKDKVNELDGQVRALEEEKRILEEQLKETEEALEEAEEKISDLEEENDMWRDKLGVMRVECERRMHWIERITFKCEDLEQFLKIYITKKRALEVELQRVTTRRRLMLEEMAKEMGRRETEGMLNAVFVLWHRRASADALRARLQELELRRQRETTELQESLDVERDKVSYQEGLVEGLKQKLRAAGTRLLERAMSTKAWPWMKSHTLSVWNGVTPLLACEKVLEKTQQELEETKAQLEFQTNRANVLEAERDALIIERDALIVERDQLLEEVAMLQDQLDSQKLGAMKDMLKMKREFEEALRKAIAAEQERFRLAQEEWDAERTALEMQIEQLESKLRAAEAAAAAGGGGGMKEDDSYRICPKGQGVLCVGCLKQLVHRSVKPLPPLAALHASAESLEAMQKETLKNELNGHIDTDDAIHKAAFKSRVDPYGISRLCLWPSGEISQSAKLPLDKWGVSASRSAAQLSSTVGMTSSASATKLSASSELLPGIPKKRGPRPSGSFLKTQLDFKAGFR